MGKKQESEYIESSPDSLQCRSRIGVGRVVRCAGFGSLFELKGRFLGIFEEKPIVSVFKNFLGTFKEKPIFPVSKEFLETFENKSCFSSF